jgi:hypothetical protein
MKTWKHTIDVQTPWNQLKDLTEDYCDEIVPETEELKDSFYRLIEKLGSYPFMPGLILDDIEKSYTDGIGLDLYEFKGAWDDLYGFCDIGNIWLKTKF